MQRPKTNLNTKKCKICKRDFKSEKALKDHIFNTRVKDREHVKYKKFLRELRFRNANKICPVCKRKFFRMLGMHINVLKDIEHRRFRKEQTGFFFKLFSKNFSPSDIEKIKSKYTTHFGGKYIYTSLKNNLGENKYFEISKRIFSNKRKKYWSGFNVEQRKALMKNVYESEWKNLSLEERRKHPWVIAGLKASLESSKKGSKNQKYAYHLLTKEFPNLKFKYNYILEKDWHVDIAIPERKIFIEWDGRHHRIPIHGVSYLNNRKNRDKIKNRIITSFGGFLIRVRDDGRENRDFVKSKVCEIKNIINKRNIWYGRVIQI